MLLRASILLPVVVLATAAAPSLTGAWTFEWSPDFGGEHASSHECQLTQQGDALAIQCDGQAMKGKVHGKTVTFAHATGLKDEFTATYRVTLDKDGTRMTGTWHLSGGPHRDGTFAAHRH